jgi:DNA-binding NarL/FixJ family response regulator
MGLVVATAEADRCEECSADVLLLDPTMVAPRNPYEYVAEQSRSRAVVIISDETPLPAERYLRNGAAGVLGRCDPVHVVVATVLAAASSGHAGAEAALDIEDRAWADGPELSEREKQVLYYISHGFTHSQAARHLGISRHTVDTYVKRIRSKFKAGNKADLTRAALFRYYAAPSRAIPST